jgi:hypothetical protein
MICLAKIGDKIVRTFEQVALKLNNNESVAVKHSSKYIINKITH